MCRHSRGGSRARLGPSSSGSDYTQGAGQACTGLPPWGWSGVRCILKGSVHDVSTYIFPRQLVDQKNKLCLISLISPKVMPRKALKHILFLFCICNSIIWLGVGCQWVIKQYFLTLHYVQNIVLDVRVESMEKSGFLIVILQRKYH